MRAARVVGPRGSNRRWWAWIVILFLAATVVRVGYVEIFRSDRVFGTFPTIDGEVTPITGVEIKQLWGDGYVYSNQANLLVDGKGLIAPLPYYLTGVQQEAADHPPLYVLYLAFWSLLGFRSELAHMLLSAPFAALCVPTFALLARRLWSPRAGLIAAFIGAFNPSIIHFPGFALSETMTLPLVALLTLFLYRLWDRRAWTDAAISGFLVGLTSLCRPDIAVMAPFAVLPIVLLLRSTAFRRKLAYLTVAGVACAAPLLPWFAFNLARYENTVLLSVGFDYSLTQGSCDQSYYGELIGYYWLPCMGERLEGTDLEYADQSIGASHLRHETMEYIRDHLAWTPVVMAARVGRVTGVFRPIQQANLEHITEDREWWLSNAAVVSYYPLAVLSIVGVVVLRRRRRLTLPLLVTIASALAGAATTLAVLRYRASAEPALAVLAAVAIDAVVTWVQRSWRDGVTPSSDPALDPSPDLPPVADRPCDVVIQEGSSAPASSATSGSRPGRGLHRMPALDGVRGLAVIAVLLFHGGFDWARGGWLGVSIFFTLSGFLITNLLVAEWARTGTISLPTFWSRRFRRLMPAAIACLLGIALYGWVLASPEQLRHLRGDLLAALGYVANWRFLLTDVSYADLFAAPSPAQHFWSLAIEEQFYVFYPLITLGALRLGGRRALAAFLGIAAVASLALAYAVRADLDRVYYGTDTRMLELVAGALVALWWSARPSRQAAPRGRTRRTGVTALGLIALGGSIALWPSVSQTATQVTRGVLPLQALLSVGIILAVARPTPLARALAWRPLVGAGLISYGLYLYHWPIFLALSPERTELSTAPLFALRIAATLAVALLSYRFLEQPIRHRRVLLTRPVVTTAVLGGAAAVVLATVAVTWSPAETQIAHADIDPDDRTVEVTRGRTDATTVPGQGSLLVVGDSGTYDIAPGLEALHLALGAPAVVDATFPGFGLSRDGWEEDYRKHVTEHDVKLTVVMLGGWDLDYVEANGRGAYEERLERAVEIFTARGGKVLWLGMMPFGIDPEMNRIYQALAKRHAGDVAFGDIGPALQGPDGDYPRWLRDRSGELVLARKPDGWHICPDGAVIVARSITEQTAALGWSAPPTTGWEDGRWRSDRRYDDPPGGCDPDRASNRPPS